MLLAFSVSSYKQYNPDDEQEFHMQHAGTEVVGAISTDSFFNSPNSDCLERVNAFQQTRVSIQVLGREVSREYGILKAALVRGCPFASEPDRPLTDLRAALYEFVVIGPVISEESKRRLWSVVYEVNIRD